MSQAASRDNAMSVAAISSQRIETDENAWTRRLVFFLRIMAVISVAKGLYHWAQVTGFIGGEEGAFENQPMAWQTATVYFAVIELVAAVGLWLATPWGAVVWLTTVVSMAVIELMFPGIYGGSLTVVGVEAVMLAAYLGLAWMVGGPTPTDRRRRRAQHRGLARHPLGPGLDAQHLLSSHGEDAQPQHPA
jgi:hypothetical protein